MIFYKVVRRPASGLLLSCRAKDESEVVYTPGVPATAPAAYARRGYHLLVFSTLAQAKRFVKGKHWPAMGDSNAEVWSCRCSRRVELPLLCFSIRKEDWTYGAVNLDDPISILPDEVPADLWPNGTLMFEEVTLLERVE